MINKQELLLRNLWWENGNYRPEADSLPKRALYSVVQNNLSNPFIINIVGLRRVGKSVMVKQTISHLLDQKVDPSNIFYHLFDYSTQRQSPEFLEEVIRSYLLQVLAEPGYNIKERVYIILDEIQYIDNWQAILKRFYDLTDKKIKFIITGSQSLLLKNRHLESLAGRITDLYLPPMLFREYLNIAKKEVEVLTQFDLYHLPETYNQLTSYNLWNSPKLQKYCNEYLTGGEFPENIVLTSYQEKHDYMRNSVLGKVIDDCIKIYKIDKTDEFKLITDHLLVNAGSIFEIDNICREIGLTKKTVASYLEYLKEAYIFEPFYKYTKSRIKRGRLLKKIYAPSTNLICALNHLTDQHVEEVPQAFGKIVENSVYNTLKDRYPETYYMDSLSFWRKGREEIDFIVVRNNAHLPIEVKFSENINYKELEPLLNYVKTKKLSYGVVVSKNDLALRVINGQTVYLIPYYLFLLCV